MSTTDRNRALEFLYQAQESFPVLHDRWGWKAKQFIALAIPEVQELLDRLAELESGGGSVCVIVTQDTEYSSKAKKRLQGFLGALEG